MTTFQGAATFAGASSFAAPYAPPVNWWIDSHSAWQGTVGISAPPFPTPDDPPIQGQYGAHTGGISAPPGFQSGPPPGDPAVVLLNTKTGYLASLVLPGPH